MEVMSTETRLMVKHRAHNHYKALGRNTFDWVDETNVHEFDFEHNQAGLCKSFEIEKTDVERRELGDGESMQVVGRERVDLESESRSTQSSEKTGRSILLGSTESSSGNHGKIETEDMDVVRNPLSEIKKQSRKAERRHRREERKRRREACQKRREERIAREKTSRMQLWSESSESECENIRNRMRVDTRRPRRPRKTRKFGTKRKRVQIATSEMDSDIDENITSKTRTTRLFSYEMFSWS